ncbi:MAG: hypothetical protein UX80_C0004G0063 [Candidatus Amesbacteria bacterium GW2011_GWA2_47_11b]|uniref:DUF1573 domain-containing protein n=3 Tax=Candidatus Amesiibacteriota TaxID=1752730 RepID=A0A0G1SKF8_9BACT|nr:MAG: hypothetical protein UX42_C0001G0038 [Microgenomates group bacterium GW2011_GWC1_46_20]KKU58312.1 MAG: hypothetical protein UX80_C0004G0063 [Candidatus Amesbacteria bacterium GW2011_GWA2_47_11b]KKU69901.1 MAG: hypothetical protein UX92_C0007G0024 [Candidatus Amesbacteria bacterium GW2011_GWA1_47_20]KKU84806.1 MAG: hypothetical protein UY11_C0003G0017 [Candidatus Amesbacteria bacterium GW2011_GWC2_47_8]
MNSKTIIIGALATFALLFGGLYLMSRPQPQVSVNPQATGQLTVAESFYDFGSVSMAKGLVTHKFTLTNAGSVPATVTKMYTSCMCTKAKLTVADQSWGPIGMPGHTAIPNLSVQIEPGQTAEVEAVFDPAAHGPAGVGVIERQVTLELNGQSPLQLSFKAVVTP